MDTIAAELMVAPFWIVVTVLSLGVCIWLLFTVNKKLNSVTEIGKALSVHENRLEHVENEMAKIDSSLTRFSESIGELKGRLAKE